MANTIRFQLRGDEGEAWKQANPVLRRNEPAYDSTENRLKFGDGKTAWNDLSYLAPDVVNDLTTGGTDKALSAEQGKELKSLIDNKTGDVEEAPEDGNVYARGDKKWYKIQDGYVIKNPVVPDLPVTKLPDWKTVALPAKFHPNKLVDLKEDNALGVIGYDGAYKVSKNSDSLTWTKISESILDGNLSRNVGYDPISGCAVVAASYDDVVKYQVINFRSNTCSKVQILEIPDYNEYSYTSPQSSPTYPVAVGYSPAFSRFLLVPQLLLKDKLRDISNASIQGMCLCSLDETSLTLTLESFNFYDKNQYQGQIEKIIWIPELEVFACGFSYSTLQYGYRVMLSPDGKTLTLSSYVRDNDERAQCTAVYDLAWGADIGVILATHNASKLGYRAISTDGVSWTFLSDKVDYGGCVAWSPDKKVFCIVSQNKSEVTADCKNFETKSLPTALQVANSTGNIALKGYYTFINDLCWSSALGKFCLVSTEFASMYTLDIDDAS